MDWDLDSQMLRQGDGALVLLLDTSIVISQPMCGSVEDRRMAPSLVNAVVSHRIVQRIVFFARRADEAVGGGGVGPSTMFS